MYPNLIHEVTYLQQMDGDEEANLQRETRSHDKAYDAHLISTSYNAVIDRALTLMDLPIRACR